MKNIHADKILIIDFGSQYTQLIARKVRELGVYSVLLPYDAKEDLIKESNPKGIILSGGPETVTLKNSPCIPEIVFKLNCPVLGICYGMQAMVSQLGGEVETGEYHEYGKANIERISDSRLIKDSKISVWMSHGDRVVSLPEGFIATAKTDSVPIVAIENTEKNYYGLQFHPEVTHTKKGKEILSQFVHEICSCGSSWNPKTIIDDRIDSLKKQIGKDNIILGLSGGVDSSVVAALLHRAIGDQLTCVLVDTGLLRLNEVEQIKKTFAEHEGVKLIVVDAKEKFFQALKGVVDPEKKRKVIGHLFIDVFNSASKKLNDIKYLAQGTIYPDVIESAGTGGKTAVIKSHHNVAGLPDELPFKLVEPLRELFKDEVREVGIALGLPREMVYRHPFPGPGLAVRILGEVKTEYIEILKQADAIFIEELFKNDLYHKIAQAFAVFLPVKSVAVKGDARRYEYVIALRAVETTDFMTADWAHIPHEVLSIISSRIINEVAGVSRVTYDISSKPPATIEWE